mmetsp:Transcript_20569/g.58667  ORF Transcript_20569/g.58667 Transcript_20569/m.58667 type:complete len:278 (+) Transcript_20569:128-961(+)
MGAASGELGPRCAARRACSVRARAGGDLAQGVRPRSRACDAVCAVLAGDHHRQQVRQGRGQGQRPAEPEQGRRRLGSQRPARHVRQGEAQRRFPQSRPLGMVADADARLGDEGQARAASVHFCHEPPEALHCRRRLATLSRVPGLGPRLRYSDGRDAFRGAAGQWLARDLGRRRGYLHPPPARGLRQDQRRPAAAVRDKHVLRHRRVVLCAARHRVDVRLLASGVHEEVQRWQLVHERLYRAALPAPQQLDFRGPLEGVGREAVPVQRRRPWCVHRL